MTKLKDETRMAASTSWDHVRARNDELGSLRKMRKFCVSLSKLDWGPRM